MLTQLPSSELPFHISCTGIFTKKAYDGDFIVRVPRTRDMSKIGVELARLNAGVRLEDLDPSTALLHNAIAYLRALLLDGPEWFVSPKELDYGLNSIDPNITLAVFQAAENKVESWYKSLMVKDDAEKK